MEIYVKEMPLFMKDKSWTKLDPVTGELLLADNVPKEVEDSYNEYMAMYHAAEEMFLIVDEKPETDEQEQSKKPFKL